MLATLEDSRTIEVGLSVRKAWWDYASLSVLKQRRIESWCTSGECLRLTTSVLKAELTGGRTALWKKLIRYTRMLLAMTGRTDACNKLHSLEQQLARWLLTMNDYVGDELRLTHDLMALTLGVRRAGVSGAASSFRDSGAIDYRRGYIQVVDRKGLEAIACECYPVIKQEYDDLYADLSK